MPLLLTLAEQCIIDNLALENIIHYYFFADYYCAGTYNPAVISPMPGHQLLAVINSYMVEHFDEITAGDSSPCKGKMRKFFYDEALSKTSKK